MCIFDVKHHGWLATPTQLYLDLCSAITCSIVMAKRPGSQLENLQDTKRVPPPKSFPAILARAGQEKYGDLLNFDLGYTASEGYHVLISCKVCH